MKRLISLTLLLPTLLLANSVEEYTLQLDFASEQTWPAAIDGLLEGDRAPTKLAVASLLRREAVLSSSQRLRLTKALQRAQLSWDPRVIEFLYQQALDANSKLANTALDGLLKAYNPAAIPHLVDLFFRRDAWRNKIGRNVLDAYIDQLDERFRALHGRGLLPQDAAKMAKDGQQNPLYWPVIAALAQHPDAGLRNRLANKLRYSAEHRSDALLWQLVNDPDTEVSEKALWSLTRRRDHQACDVVLDKYWHGQAALSGEALNSALQDSGEVCAATHLLQFYALIVAAPHRPEHAAHLLSGMHVSALEQQLDDPLFRGKLAHWQTQGNAAVAANASALLANWQAQQASASPSPARIALLILCVLTTLLGLLIFFWGLRLLLVLRLLLRTARVSIKSAPLGTNLLRGSLRPADHAALSASDLELHHPISGEPCLYYIGADKDWPQQRFYLEDNSGRLLIDPRDAVLLSSDGVLLDNEEVEILGSIAKSQEPGSNGRILLREHARRTLIGRIAKFVIGGVMGQWSPKGVTPALFSDPLRVFWILDDLASRPLAQQLGLLQLVLVFLLAGAWITLFSLIAAGSLI